MPDVAGIPDLRIAPVNSAMALHGDHVQATVYRARPGTQPRARITRILKHANRFILGQVHHSGRYAYVYPRNKKIQRIVEIRRRLDPEEVPDGAWVMAEVREWTASPDEPLVGQISEVIGTEAERGMPILLLLRGGGVEVTFPADVEREAASLGKAAGVEVMDAARSDFRGERVFTIDPATAKDFDDAINLFGRADGGWRIGVHIADVAHYVRPGGRIDAEAYERGTSIYPVDRVIPMLPETLSNGLCSLRPGEDKCTMSAVFTVGSGGEVRDVELCESVIQSVRRFAYEEVQGLLDEQDVADGTRPADAPVRFPRPVVAEALRQDILEIRRASRAIRKRRFQRGALDLDLPETEILFDADGTVRDLRRKERFEAHMLIEDLMIAANEAVPRELERRGYPLLYRVHDEPSEDKVRTIEPVLARFNIPIPKEGSMTREQLRKALEAARRHPAGVIIQRWVLRAMMRAKYQPENIGHFGLASDCYAHFTSPIRRYPDLVVHRVVKAMLAGEQPGGEKVAEMKANLPSWGRHTSMREERAQKIEWDAQEILGLQFMRRYIGDVFDGFISGVNAMGFWVELKDYPVEGLVRVRDLDDDFYDLDEDYHVWRGRSSRRAYGLGEPVPVMIDRIDVLAGPMDLILLKQNKGKGKSQGRTGAIRSGKGPRGKYPHPTGRRRRGR